MIIGPNAYIGPECKIGKNSIIHANSSLVMNVEIGENTIIHFNSILGSDGFGYAQKKNGYIKIEQLGKLIVGDNVEIGAGCTIDRGAIDNTEIHSGVKLDNQVHIAHNVVLGENSAIAASCAIAGSTTRSDNSGITDYTSSWINANPEWKRANSIHTVSYTTTGYKGTIKLQATLDLQPTNGTSWVDVSSVPLNGYSGTNYVNVSGVYSWIRIQHTPDSSNTGTVDKISIRS